MEKKYNKKLMNFSTFFFGSFLLIYLSGIVIRKVTDMIMKGENILTTNLSIESSQLWWVLILSLLFLISILIEDRKILHETLNKYISKFMAWIIYISISAILIHFLLLFSITKLWFNLIILLALFCLFVLKEKIEKESEWNKKEWIRKVKQDLKNIKSLRQKLN